MYDYADFTFFERIVQGVEGLLFASQMYCHLGMFSLHNYLFYM